MSVVQNPIIGRAKQKLGGTVFTTWKGINVLKGKPLTVANPKTDKQLMRRSALEQIVAIGRKIASAINLGFKEQAFQKSAFNAFTGYNLRNSFDYSAPPVAELEPNQVLVSQGTISPTIADSVTGDASDARITFEYPTAATLPGQSSTDQARGVLYNATTGEWFAAPNFALRSANQLLVTTPDGFLTAGDTVYSYLFFYNTTTRKSSDSVINQITVNP